MRRSLFLFLLILSLVFLAGCNQETKKKTSRPEKNLQISFVTDDGTKLEGRLFGSGDIGVILAHMYPVDQRSWNNFAEQLAKKGFLVMTFNFRGYGGSGGSRQIDKIYLDEAAAIKYLRGRGAKKLFLIGASMGGTASLKAAATSDITAVVSLSAPIEFQGLSVHEDIRKIKTSKIFIASELDPANAAAAAKWFYDNSTEPKDIKIFSGDKHGTNLLTGAEGVAVKAMIINFINKYR